MEKLRHQMRVYRITAKICEKFAGAVIGFIPSN
jgi:hypothetical protein